jgi:superfamily II DNA helicase RecQ
MQEFSEHITTEYVSAVIQNRFGFSSKEKQIDCIRTMLIDQEDLILYAKTSFGKSLIYQAAPLMFNPPMAALIIIPFKALEDQQCRKLSIIEGCRPFVLNGDTNKNSNLRLIRQNSFTHGALFMNTCFRKELYILTEIVFTSPEIATSKLFNDEVLCHPSYFQNLCLLAIDEIHLVSEWRSFRPEYFNLGVLRARLPDGIPFQAGSATLDSQTFASVMDRCGFDIDTRIVKMELDRPEIYIQINTLQHTIKSMLDLQFILPSRATSYLSIPKTIIFMDSIASIKAACALIRRWMLQLGYPAVSSSWISPFFSDMATTDKERIAARFEILSHQCTGPRILVATDAYGLGIDNKDVKQVVQWLMPMTMARLYQRMGRALRCGIGQARFVLLHPSWCVGPRSGMTLNESEGRDNIAVEAGPEADEQSGKKKDADRRRDLSRGLWDLTNVPSGGCIREIGLFSSMMTRIRRRAIYGLSLVAQVVIQIFKYQQRLTRC